MAGRVFEARGFRAGDAVPVRGDGIVVVEFDIAFEHAGDVESGDRIDEPMRLAADKHRTERRAG